MQAVTSIEVIAWNFWSFGGGIMPDQKQWSRVSKCRVDGVTFYVRENLDGAQSFYVSSNERWKFKGGNNSTDRAGLERQCLDLCAPAAEWDRIAELVRAADSLGRRVRKHRTFTERWAEQQIATGINTRR